VTRLLVSIALLLGFGAVRVPIERTLVREHRQAGWGAAPLDLGLREQIGQLSFIAALSGFRSIVADVLFIRAHVAWEQTEWARLLLLLRQTTSVQPRSLLFWDMAAWHMAWNASAAAINDPQEPRLTVRRRRQLEYFDLGRDFLERGISHNPDKPQLLEAMARLDQQKYNDHLGASEYLTRAAALPGAMGYDRRFSAYELSYCEGHEREAYDRLRDLYNEGPQERLPTLLTRLKFLEEKLNIPQDQRIP
jgi:hypothetical protein